MRTTISRIRLAGLGLAALLAMGSTAAAETVQMKADLKGSNCCYGKFPVERRMPLLLDPSDAR